MNKFYMIINLVLLFASISSAALARNNEETLCHEKEESHFTCILENKKMVSVCKNGNNSEQQYVQYRYGTPGNLEMIYPEKLLSAKGHIFYVNESAGSVGSESIFFQTGLYRYTIFNTQGNQGLYVEKGKATDINKKNVFSQFCDSTGAYVGVKRWKDSFQEAKEYYWTGKNKPI